MLLDQVVVQLDAFSTERPTAADHDGILLLLGVKEISNLPPYSLAVVARPQEYWTM